MAEEFPNTPSGLYYGARAMTVQFFLEANIKNGLQYEVSLPISPILAAANSDVVFITGSKPVIVKVRELQFNGAQLTARVYRGPSYTGGTPISIWGLNDITQTPTTVSVLAGSTVTNPGVEFGAPNYMLGSTGIGSSSLGSYAIVGFERVLRSNTTYMLRITNSDTNTQSLSGRISWYEGTPDLPTP